MTRFMFWLYVTVPTSFQVTGTPPDNKYTSESQIHVALHILGIFESTCGPPGPRYTSGSQVHPRVPDSPPVPSYTSDSQVHPRFPDIPSGLRYRLRFLFWLYLKVLVSLQVPGTTSGLLMIIKSLQKSSKSPQVQKIFIYARGLGDLVSNGPGALSDDLSRKVQDKILLAKRKRKASCRNCETIFASNYR